MSSTKLRLRDIFISTNYIILTTLLISLPIASVRVIWTIVMFFTHPFNVTLIVLLRIISLGLVHTREVFQSQIPKTTVINIYTRSLLHLSLSLLFSSLSYLINSHTLLSLKFFKQNELLLQDGFFIDFLQKQTLNMWLRQYILSTGCVFSERILFEAITKFYFRYILWPIKTRLTFETFNVSELVSSLLYIIVTILLMVVILFFIY